MAAPLAGFVQTLIFGLVLTITNAGYGGGVDNFQDGLVLVVAGGIAVGVILALAQVGALFRTSVPKWSWSASTIAGLSLCNVLLYGVWCVVSEYAPSFIDLLGMAYMDDIGPRKLLGYCTMLALGVVQGAIVWVIVQLLFCKI